MVQSIEVTKIDIVRDVLHVPPENTFIRVRRIDGFKYFRNDPCEPNLSVSEEDYLIRRVWCEAGGKRVERAYAVREGDAEAFSDLLSIMRDDIEKAKAEAHSAGRALGYARGIVDCFRDTVTTFAGKPWWYRLFVPRRMMRELRARE